MLIGIETKRDGGLHSAEIWQHLEDRGLKNCVRRVNNWPRPEISHSGNILGRPKKGIKGQYRLWEWKRSIHQCGGHCSCCIPRCDRREAWRNRLSSPWPRAVSSSPGKPRPKCWHNSCWKSSFGRESQKKDLEGKMKLSSSRRMRAREDRLRSITLRNL
jgi:hypothetical protein